MYVDPVQCGYSSVKKLPRKVQSGAIHQLKSGTVKRHKRIPRASWAVYRFHDNIAVGLHMIMVLSPFPNCTIIVADGIPVYLSTVMITVMSQSNTHARTINTCKLV